MTTDELIETLERLEKEFIAARSLTAEDLICQELMAHLTTIISALKENKRLREALAFDTELCAYVNLLGAREDLGNTNGNDEITRRTIDRVLGQLADARAALQPQGEK